MVAFRVYRLAPRVLLAGLAALALAACGPGIGGAWSGTLTQTLPGPASYQVTMTIHVGESVSISGATGWMLNGNFSITGVGSGSLTGSYWEAGGMNGVSLVLSVSGGDSFFLFGTLVGGQISGDWDAGVDLEGTFTLSR